MSPELNLSSGAKGKMANKENNGEVQGEKSEGEAWPYVAVETIRISPWGK